MPRQSLIDTHDKRDEILKAMAMGLPSTEIAARYGMSASTVDRYRRSVPSEVRQASEAAFREGAQASSQALLSAVSVVQKVIDELDTRLTDPGDPSRYWLGPQADEVEIAYTEYNAHGKPVLRRNDLQTLLDKTGHSGFREIRWKREDPRRLLLAAADLLGKQLERFENLTEKINASNIREAEAQEMDLLMADVISVLNKYPKAKQEVIDAIRARRDLRRVPDTT